MGKLRHCSAHYKFGHYIVERKTTLRPVDRKLDGHHSRQRRSFEETKMTACPENRNSFFQSRTRSLVTVNDLLHVNQFSSKWQSPSFYRTGPMYSKNINAYKILELVSNKKNEGTFDPNQKLYSTKKGDFLTRSVCQHFKIKTPPVSVRNFGRQ